MNALCGIVGMVGENLKIKNLLDALKKLEYRGYDSSGIAFPAENRVFVEKETGRIKCLEKKLGSSLNEPLLTGIAHTRWATHGVPSNSNAHPHIDCTGKLAIVHNGIIENYEILKSRLESRGHEFDSATDTEVIAHLIEEHYTGDLVEAVSHAIVDLKGAYAIAAVHSDHPYSIVATRKGSPLVVGINEKGGFLASDVTPLLKYIRDVYFLEDGDIALINKDKVTISRIDGTRVSRSLTHITWNEEAAEKSGYDHFMLKEIFEEPQTIRNAISGRITESKAMINELVPFERKFKEATELTLVACGTSYHAGMVFKRFLEDYANLSVDIDVASEFRYRNLKMDKNTLMIAISQSGETADTLESVRTVKKAGGTVIALTNTVGSTLSRESDAVVYLNAGPEIGVAATKTYVSQLTVLLLIGCYISRIRGNDSETLRLLVNDLTGLPTVFENIINTGESICRELAKEYYDFKHFMYIGRGYGYPTALEGSLKLKEISYIHASAYQAGELKHGPIALIERDFPVFVIVPDDYLKVKTLSNVMETRARDSKVVAICSEGDSDIRNIANSRIEIPIISEPLYPLIMAPYLQLFAYNVAVLKGYDPDKPRNLAKSVTVE